MLCLGMVLYAAYRGTEEQRNPSNQDGLVSLVRVSCLTNYIGSQFLDRLGISGLIAVVTSVPVLASVLSFVTTAYSIAIIWY